MLNDSNFIKWLALKAFIINEVSNYTKIAILFAVILNKTRANNLLRKISLKIKNKSCNKGLKY